ncbi:MAG: DUF3108 domain-containing protein [Polaromonas sp.]
MSTLTNSSLTSPFPPAQRAAPPWRTLAVLVVLVLAAHALVLRTSPTRFSPEQSPASRRAPAFATRSIELPPPVQASAPPTVAVPPATPAAKPVARPAKKTVSKEKEAVTHETPALPAIDSIAPPVSGPAAAEESTASPDAASLPLPGTATTETPAADTATAAASAASAPAAPPPGPQQTPVTAMALPESARLDYKVRGSAKGLNYYANAELAWNNTGSDYEARMTVSALFIGSRTMASKGQVGAEGLAPTRFSDKYRNEVAAHFEPDKGQVSFSANTPSVPWVKGGQDRVSVFLQLSGMLAGDPAAFPVGSSMTMYTVGPRDADSWTFLVEAEEKLTLPFGELTTLKLARQPRREFDQKVEIWYAPSLGYLPVRSKITQSNGDFVDQQLTAVNKH